MKIKLLCEEPARLAALKRAIAGNDDGVEVTGGVGNVEGLSAFINGSMPDVVVVDSASTRSLQAIEALALRRPGLNAIVISQDSAPPALPGKSV